VRRRRSAGEPAEGHDLSPAASVELGAKARMGKPCVTRREQSLNAALASLSIGDYTAKWITSGLPK
jgi:hypothetical protein